MKLSVALLNDPCHVEVRMVWCKQRHMRSWGGMPCSPAVNITVDVKDVSKPATASKRNDPGCWDREAALFGKA